MLDSYLSKRPGSSYLQLRVPVPVDVQAMYGRKEFTKSLRERNPAKAEAKALPILASLHAEWEALRAKAQVDEVSSVHADGTPTETQLLALALQVFDESRAIAVERRASINARPCGRIVVR